ncbi:hypothetical protein M422DRAFT_248211 [Sphaerobolus stellatus SS14]|uniref:Uncharacterized protein n=1 Tax=Sphaerobolus stellatus (strain SS14) TaxID=990650 RepID=A0A0C9UWL9_SPHS4|nr:hypothetical protein M422DRAFT_248211 [Sphaerobolus stellatus SS14]
MVFTSPNQKTLPTIPQRFADAHWNTADPEKYINVQWYSESYPYMALSADLDLFEDIIFRRLQFYGDSFPIVKKGESYSLLQDIIREWQNLEIALRFIATQLLSYSRVRLPLSWDWLLYPSQLRYPCWHKKHTAAIKCSRRSRDAILALTAAVSLGIILFERTSNVPSETSPCFTYIMSLRIYPTAWLECLARSFVGDFTSFRCRFGTIVDISTLHSPNLICELLNIGVPIWYHWGPVGITPTPIGWDIIDNYIPPTTNFNLITTYHQKPSNSYMKPLHSHAPSFLNRQLTDETFDMFMNREGRRHSKMLQVKDISATKSRESRFENASCQQFTSSELPWKSAVFAWLKTKFGQCIRTLVTGKELEWHRELYTPHQRQYNAFDDEWNLCSEFTEPEAHYNGHPLPNDDFDTLEDDKIHLLPRDDLIVPIKGGFHDVENSISTINIGAHAMPDTRQDINALDNIILRYVISEQLEGDDSHPNTLDLLSPECSINVLTEFGTLTDFCFTIPIQKLVTFTLQAQSLQNIHADVIKKSVRENIEHNG